MSPRVPTPQQIGLPEKFGHWRPNQEESLRRLLISTKRVKALAAPTGFGKTLTYVAYALLTNKPTCFVTDNRGLQDQLLDQFREVGMVDIRGRRNYECGLRPDMTCDEGYASRCPHKGTINCPSSRAERRASVSSLVVTNYDKWTSAKKFGTGMNHFQQVVFDEGHKAPDALARAMQILLGDREIRDVGLDFPAPADAQEMVNWKPWAVKARSLVKSQLQRAQALIATSTQPKSAWVRNMTHLKYLERRLGQISVANPENWIVDETEKGYQFDPIRPGRFSEAMLLLKLPSILIVSATLRPKTLFMLGLGKDTFDFQEYDSDFDPARCPIYYVPTMRVDSRASSLHMLWILLDQIAARRQDRKGLVHTISYSRRDEILRASRFAARMLVNERGEASTWMVDQFKRSGPGTILVSPSIGEGFDFPGKDCEWQFICKIPFQDSRSKIVKARQEDDKEYGPYQAINKLVQICGRPSRSKQDQAETFIGDQHLDWFMPRYGHLAPKSFHRFYKRVSVVPPPLPRL